MHNWVLLEDEDSDSFMLICCGCTLRLAWKSAIDGTVKALVQSIAADWLEVCEAEPCQ